MLKSPIVDPSRLVGSLLCLLLLLLSPAVLWAAPQHPTLPFGGLTVVQEIDCGATPPVTFTEFPTGASSVTTILGSPARVMGNSAGGQTKYFAYRIGEGLGLEAGKGYVLEVEYPEDADRAMVILNYGEASARGLHTGKTVGDALLPPYVSNNGQSVNVPLAGSWKTWRQLFHLHDRFSGIERIRGDGFREFVPADGFWVLIAQFPYEDEPLSAGAAVRKIRLLEAPPVATYDASLQLPPQGLPRRHLFVRDEMSDGIAGLGFTDPTHRGVLNTVDYFEYKARQMKFLGMNTFCKDLLEFGANQGWDSAPGGGNSWYYTAKEPQLWEDILDMLGAYDLDVMPYYEYAGSEGSAGLGGERRARPLAPYLTNYTQISWAESSRADLADPDTLADARLLLDVTMTRYRNKADFVGAWFRARVSQMPLSFADSDIQWFSEEEMDGQPVSREQLQTVTSLYNQYKAWWFGKRRDFVVAMRDHLRAQGVSKDAVVLYTGDSSEPGVSPAMDPPLIAEDTGVWSAVGVSSVTPATAEAQGRHRKAVTMPRGTYSGWEWQHATPEHDPGNYAGLEGAMLTYTFNKPYTLAEQSLLDEFQTQSGKAMIRHYSLNEDVPDSNSGETPVVTDPLGYFVADMERTGPYVMMGEALALAKGDPRYIGYLSSNTFTRGFPEYVRAFNQAFLALPAVPGEERAGASSNANVVVRDYATDGFGTYIAVINTAMTDQTVNITLPYRAELRDATTNAVISSATTSLNGLEMYPFQVRAFRLDKRSTTGPIAADDSVTVNEGSTTDINVIGNDSGPGTLTISGFSTPENGTVSLVANQARYIPNPGFYGTDSFRYTVGNGADTDMARVYVTVTNTAVAQNLDGWGILPANIGAEDTGRDRVLANGTTGEVVGFGSGAAGTGDNGRFVERVISGNFQATVKVESLAGTGDALGGLMFRQSNDPGARMAALLVAPGSGGIRLVSRSAAGGEAAGSSVSSSGAVWLRIVREGDLVTLLRSTNGTTYSEIGWRSFPGLPASVRVGLWASGGDRYTGSRMLVSGWAATASTSGELFQQDFSASSIYTDYIDAGGAFGTFGNISGETNAGAIEIDATGALKFNGATGADPNDSGFTRHAGFTLSGGVLKTSFSVSLADVNTYSDVAIMEWGNFPSFVDYGSNGTNPNPNVFARVILRGAGTGKWRINQNGTFYGNFPADGTLHELTVYLSRSGSNQTYTGPNGQQHTLNAGCGSLWVGDMPLAENWERGSNLTGTDPTHIKFRNPGANTGGSTPVGVVFRLDNLQIEDRFGATTPGHGNSAPVAVNDTTSTPEGTPVLVNVLANDSDADAGPVGLHLTGVTGGNGTAEIVGGRILYTPAPGFFGVNVLNYTLSDGAATDTATLTVTVSNTATASNLVSANLTGAAVGGGSAGGSRILADGYWELAHTGGSPTSSSDALWWESRALSGNFQVEARVRELQGNGASPMGGLVIREGSGANARMVRVGLNPSALAKIQYRTATGANYTTSPEEASMQFPAAWVQLDRFGDFITVRASADGMNFVDLDTVQIPGLAENVQAGLWITQARMAVAGFTVRPWQRPLLSMDFEGSTALSTFARELDPEPNQLSDISAEAAGGAWSIDGGQLRFDRGTSTGADAGAGFSRNVPFAGPPQLLRVSFDMKLANITASNSDLFVLEFGNFPKWNEYDAGIPMSTIHSRLTVRGRGAGHYALRLGGTNSPNIPVTTSLVPVVMWVNDSGASAPYVTPDGQLRVLQHHRISIWVGDGVSGSLPFEDVPKESNFTSSTMAFMRMRMINTDYSVWFDNLLVTDEFVPEIAPLAFEDQATTASNTAVTIPAVANDADGDEGPSPLFITGVSPGAHGTASLVSGQVEYTPGSGYTGEDVLNYTLSDGDAVDWGQIRVLVTGSAVAGNLSAHGLTGSSIGSGSSGSSADLGGRVWRLQGTGSGLGGTADSLRGEFASYTGDFQAVVKLSSLSAGTGGRLGLMIREGTGADTRFLALSSDAAGTPRHAMRTSTGGSVSESTVSGAWQLPATYLRISRTGTTLAAAVSQNGRNFTEVASQNFASLASTVQAGLWVSGGSGGATGTAVFQDLRLQRLGINFETVGAAGQVSGYIGTPAGAGLFHNLSAEVDGGEWSVESVYAGFNNYTGRLKLTRPVSSGNSTNGAGFTRFSTAGGSPQKLAMTFRLTVAGNTDFTDIAILDLGTFTSLQDYNGATPSSGVADRLVIKGGGAGIFRLRLNSTNSADLLADGTKDYLVHWFINHSGASTSYDAPDGSSQSLSAGRCDLWVDGVQLFDNFAKNGTLTGTNMGGVRFRTSTNAPVIMTFDDLETRELP